MIHIGEESTQEENVGKPEEGDGPVSEKTPPREEKAEDKTGKIKRIPCYLLERSPAAQCGELEPAERRRLANWEKRRKEARKERQVASSGGHICL